MPARVEDRTSYFWSKVRRGEPAECWEWTAGTYANGYGQIQLGGKKYKAHRYAAWLSGLIERPEAPEDMTGGGFVLHRCDNKRCCNPEHLSVGTYRQNVKEAFDRGLRQMPNW